MKAFRMVGWKTPPEYAEVPVPDPGPGQVLVKVGAAGLCHSDLHVVHEFDEGSMNASPPFTLGHENAGWVEALGPGARGVEVGEPVAVFGSLGCGVCALCQTGDENLCARQAELPGAGWGLGVDGGMAQYMLVDRVGQLVPLGELSPTFAAPLTDAAVTPYRAIRRSVDALGPGSSALVIGVGGLGHIAVQLLRALSSTTVIALDAKPEALGLATEMGAHHTLTAGPDNAAEVLDLTAGRGADVVLDIVGVEATLQLAFAVAAIRGRVMIVGVAGGTAPLGFFTTRYEVQVSNTVWGGIGDLRDVIALAERGLVTPKITTYAFDQIPDAFHALETGNVPGRAVILPNG